ncbi:putative serine/threonine-protein kinase SIS8 [Chlorella vulgaris]
MGACTSKLPASTETPSVSVPEDTQPPTAATQQPATAAAVTQPAASPPDAQDVGPYVGAPRPANEAERVGLLRALGVLDSEQGPDPFDSITKLLCGVFGVPISLVSLVDSERQWFKSVQGLGTCMQTGREESFCAWTLLPETPYVLIVEDALEDKRFRSNPLVVGPPHIRFYAGAPLISSASGYRYGTLCVIDTKPHREFAAEAYNLLIQFSELCVREIEKDKLTMLQKMVQQSGTISDGILTPLDSLRSSATPSATAASSLAAVDRRSDNAPHHGLTRAADCFREAVMLVDVSIPQWTVLYTNDAFTAVSGVSRHKAVAQSFWELFSAPGMSADSFASECDASEPFTLAVGVQTNAGQRHSPKLAIIDFRPGSTGQLGGHSQSVGIPATAPLSASKTSRQSATPRYYFGILRMDTASKQAASPSAVASPVQPLAQLEPATQNAADRCNTRASLDSQRSHTGLASFKRAMPSAFTDVRLGSLIGRGAYGRVYRASWNGTTVAVKVIETTEVLGDGSVAGKSGIFEAVLATNLSHPNIVHTYQYAFRPVTAEELEVERESGNSGVSGSSMGVAQQGKVATEVWLVSEFCNRGPLLTAIERGAFLTQPSSQYGQPNLISVLQTLQEIAAALQYLHRNDVMHGDLTGGNVLLTVSDKDTRGFTAKVVDFGLSRVCSEDYLRTRTLGCAEYMPPELITEGILTKAADVYAFGVITWEIYVGRRAWEGLKPTEVLRKVASNTRLEFPAQTPHRLKVLGERCMEYAPSARPTMEEVLSEVNSILSDTMGILQQFLTASAASSMAGALPVQPSDLFRVE